MTDELLADSRRLLAELAPKASDLSRRAANFADQRGFAKARLEGATDDERPIVLFVCEGNSGRSQAAAALLNAYAGARAISWSAGSKPDSDINPDVVELLARRNVDASGGYPKPWTAEILDVADVIVNLGAGDDLPVIEGKQNLTWDVGHPKGPGVAGATELIELIDQHVNELILSLGID
ncbi:low molecular weight phosphatase family protein [Natronoglycomyces albus]|uniref:Phosphotyrosine protein phosphatase I domain-containing protein n=1 Tax=Natronoglycomyces albus TaxID=2811108 RepID=A0A895XPD7_9ACTN|nr:arsenate reductase ArsC [Natronoglycomyces albus]QSB05612.1 hypothetical protein JQS30_01390 [Natronoglycomyces albus]